MKALRIVIYSQIVWIALVGMLIRGVVRIPESIPPAVPPWCGSVFAYIFVMPLYVFPMLVIGALVRRHAPVEQVIVIAGIEIGLTIALFIAMLPAVQ